MDRWSGQQQLRHGLGLRNDWGARGIGSEDQPHLRCGRARKYL